MTVELVVCDEADLADSLHLEGQERKKKDEEGALTTRGLRGQLFKAIKTHHIVRQNLNLKASIMYSLCDTSSRRAGSGKKFVFMHFLFW